MKTLIVPTKTYLHYKHFEDKIILMRRWIQFFFLMVQQNTNVLIKFKCVKTDNVGSDLVGTRKLY